MQAGASMLQGQPQSSDFAAVDFPSGALSMKRLRPIFPEWFDEGLLLTDGYGGFFVPLDHE
jgi:hypothetical protein